MERRLAAILAADVVGYSRLMGEDETGTLERLKSLRKELVQPKITERKGRIVKLMGDGLLAEFPSVVEAVKCADRPLGHGPGGLDHDQFGRRHLCIFQIGRLIRRRRIRRRQADQPEFVE